MELGGNGYFSPGVVGEAENGLRPSRLFCSVFYSASSILVFCFVFFVFLSLSHCQEMEEPGIGG